MVFGRVRRTCQHHPPLVALWSSAGTGTVTRHDRVWLSNTRTPQVLPIDLAMRPGFGRTHTQRA